MTNNTIYDCITEKAIAKFKPTRLYIKQHSVTGVMYFGKTIKDGKNFDNYTGAGKRWLHHLKKHGKEYVIIKLKS